MSKHSFHPSQFLPQYLQLDLGVGGSSEHPVVRAIDESIETSFHTLQQHCFRLMPNELSVSNQRRLLEYQGLAHKALNDAEVARFHEMLPELNEKAGSLYALKQMALLYLGTQNVTLGRPEFEPQPMEAKSVHQLKDDEAATQFVFIRLEAAINATRLSEFRHNAHLYIPSSLKIEIAVPLRFVNKENRLSLKAPFPLRQRRL